MCLLCAAEPADRDLARRSYVLHLLALVENPDALPADAALRLAREILMMTGSDSGRCRCEAVAPPDGDKGPDMDRRPS